MDKKTIISIIAGIVLFGGVMYINSKQQDQYQKDLAAYNESMAQESAIKEKIAERERVEFEKADTLSIEQKQAVELERNTAQFGDYLAKSLQGEAQPSTLENSVLKVDFTSKGAQIAGVTLKDYTKYNDNAAERTELIEMFDRANALMNFEYTINNQKIKSSDFYFSMLPVQEIDGGMRQTFVLNCSPSASIEYIYTLYNSDNDSRNYLLDFDIKFNNMESLMANQSSFGINWRNTTYQNERGFKNENTYTTLSYHIKGENSVEDLGVSEKNKNEGIGSPVEWVGFKQQYFIAAFIARNNFGSANLSYNTAQPGSGYMKNYSADISVPFSTATDTYSFGLYYGPTKYATLKGLDDLGYGKLVMDDVIPLGWGIFGWVSKWIVIPTFDFLRKFISNFGLIILILAVFVKLITSIFTYKSYVSMAKMRVIKPEVDALNEKYPKKEDAMKRQQATMDLYKKAGVNPMGGCLPMLIQMPIIIAMFRFFPASIELREQPFLWSSDLSSYDSIINLPFNIPFYGDHVSLFALLMAISMFAYSYINYKQTASSQPQMAGMKFMMVYMMPVMMLFWFNSYSSGLCYYYLLANLLTIAQTTIIRHMVDDNKIHALMQANAAKAKNTKKSKFQLRYEELMAEQERQKQNKNKK